jgi:hypothetical protein
MGRSIKSQYYYNTHGRSGEYGNSQLDRKGRNSSSLGFDAFSVVEGHLKDRDGGFRNLKFAWMVDVPGHFGINILQAE